MAVLKKNRFVIGFVSLSGVGLLAGLLQAQTGPEIINDQRGNEPLALRRVSTFPVQSRQLLTLEDLGQKYPSTGVDPFIERQQHAQPLPSSQPKNIAAKVTINHLPPLDRKSIGMANAKPTGASPVVAMPVAKRIAKPVAKQDLSLSWGALNADRLQTRVDESSPASIGSKKDVAVDEAFVVPPIPAVLQAQFTSNRVVESLQVGQLPGQSPSVVAQTKCFEPVRQRMMQQVSQPAVQSVMQPVQINLADKLLWWKNDILNATIQNGTPQTVETNSLVYFMLQRSPRLRAVSQNPLIREQQIVEAEAEFDPVSFLQTQFQDRVDPVGDSLSVTNDGSDFLDDHIWTADLGVRRKAASGATVELNQRLGFRNSNSNFFDPQDQGTATLALNVTQPLLRGRGEYFNRSQILIAQSAANASWDTLSIELQTEIQSVVEAYWRLYFDRCVFLQKQMNVRRAESVLVTLEGRSTLDALPSQVARARSAVHSRRTELANSRRDIRNSETDIRRLTADSNWAANQMVELLPNELPDLHIPVVDLHHAIVTAINHRPEIREAVKRSKVAAIQRDISVNELLPELSLLLGTYVSTLEGDSRLGDAFVDQFGRVKPGYSVGVEFELPIRNRAARSRLTQRKLQMNLIKAEIDETMQNVIAEAQIARRRVISAKETLAAAIEAISAARLEMEQNEGRWESFALVEGDIAEGQSPTVVLDRLLDSQERLAAAELVYAQAEMELKVAEVALQRTMGTLLIHRSVSYGQGAIDDTPMVNFDIGR